MLKLPAALRPPISYRPVYWATVFWHCFERHGVYISANSTRGHNGKNDACQCAYIINTLQLCILHRQSAGMLRIKPLRVAGVPSPMPQICNWTKMTPICWICLLLWQKLQIVSFLYYSSNICNWTSYTRFTNDWMFRNACLFTWHAENMYRNKNSHSVLKIRLQ